MANEYLQRTPTSTGNRRVFTWSGWVKRNILGTDQNLLCSTEPGLISKLFFNTNNKLDYQNNSPSFELITSQTFRDTGNWTHVLFVAETTASISSERIRLYVNGVRIAKFDTETYPAINSTLIFNYPISHFISNESSNVNYFTGEFTDIFFIDGQALTPDVFGFYKVGKGYVSAGSTQSTDFRPGQWVPKTPRVIKTAINNNGGFGVNGFYLPMNDSNNFGADFHCEPNSIIKLQENLPQPRSRIDGVGDYTGALRDDPFKQYLVLALPFVSGGLQSGFGDYSAAIKGSGSAKTLTNTNVSIASTASYYGNAGLFNGTSSQLTIPASSDFDLSSTDFTIEMWANPRTLKNGNTILSLGTGGNALYWVLYVGQSGGEITIGFGNGGWGWTTSGSGVNGAIAQGTSVKSNQWNHVAVVRKSNILTAYVNGTSVGITTNFNFGSGSAGTLYIGSYFQNYNDDGSYWDGYLQDLRIYKGVAKYKGGFDVPRPYTPVGIATWRAVPDSPANNFATLNPLVPSVFSSGDRSISNGNLTVTTITTGNGTNARSTIGVSTGRWYAETYLSGDTNGAGSFLAVFGIGRTDNQTNASSGDHINYYGSNGNKYDYDNGSPTISSYGSTYTTGDIIGISINGDNGEVVFYKNGVSQGVAKTFTTSQYPLFFQMEDGASAATVTYNMNFGQNPTFSGNTTAGTYTDSNNKGLFKYQPPSGFLALCEDNLPTPAISDPGKHFKTVLYRGSGASRNLVGIGFTPDLVWVKSRTNGGYYHNLVDSVRGPSRRLASNSTNAEDDASAGGATPILGSFDYDGFSLPNGNVNVNESGQNYVAWCWKAGAGTTSTNTNGSITSVVSVNQDAGFSIVSYTGNSSSPVTIGHGLGKKPSFIIVKNRDLTSTWYCYHSALGAAKRISLESPAQAFSGTALWNSTEPSSTIFTTISDTATNNNGSKHIAYCWAEIEGFSKFGSYTGNGSTDGPFVYCGFKPAWVMIKSTDASNGWIIMDNARKPINPNGEVLFVNDTIIEQTDLNYRYTDFVSNGFKIRAGIGSERNSNGVPYIFVAFAESPFQTANAK